MDATSDISMQPWFRCSFVKFWFSDFIAIFFAVIIGIFFIIW